jgi:hypothetical protein
MKNWLVCILLFITATGTFIPCCSVDDCCADRLVNTTNHDKHNNEGTCSPFFACATCPASVELAKSVKLDFLAVGNLIHHQQIIELPLPSYSSSFWKPPRSC